MATIEQTRSETLTVLGIETSCDETAAAVVRRNGGHTGVIVSNVVLSQLDEHAPYGGVVPELAARAHVLNLDSIIARAIDEAQISWSALDGVAATAGPGLIGGVIVGLTTAKSIALVHDLPLMAVNHLEGHALTAGLTDNVPFPYLLLLVSGGHSQLLSIDDVGAYTRFGTTVDDALGEAFDKTAKLLDLGYPGGPAVERAAKQGDPERFALPRPMVGRQGCDFSFSGLKTAVRRHAEASAPLSNRDVADLCASFQAAVCDIIEDRTRAALHLFAARHGGDMPPTLVATGGVAANGAIRAVLARLGTHEGFRLVAPPPELCTDNAAMIAWAGLERLSRGMIDGLDAKARARWPLDSATDKRAEAGIKA